MSLPRAFWLGCSRLLETHAVLFCPSRTEDKTSHRSGWKPESGPASSSRLPLRHTPLSPTASGLPEIGSRSYLISPVAPTCAPLRSRDPLEHPSCLLLPFPPHPQASQTDRGRRITDRATGRPDGTDHRVEGAGKEKDGVGARQTVRGRAYV